jgi:hypothetical protein
MVLWEIKNLEILRGEKYHNQLVADGESISHNYEQNIKNIFNLLISVINDSRKEI